MAGVNSIYSIMLILFVLLFFVEFLFSINSSY